MLISLIIFLIPSQKPQPIGHVWPKGCGEMKDLDEFYILLAASFCGNFE